MCFPTLEQAIGTMQATYDQLTQQARAAASRRPDLEVGLQNRIGQPVEVWTLPAQAFVVSSPTSPPQQRNGTGMFYDGRYVIFISDSILPDGWWPPQLDGFWAERFIVWHETGHILHDEVFENNPEKRHALMRRAHEGDGQALQEMEQSEIRADATAVDEVAKEAKEEQDAELAAALEQAWKLRVGSGS